MNGIVLRWIEETTSRLELEGPVVEFGSMQVEGQEGYADIRRFFGGMEFIGCDIRPGPGGDRVDDMERSDRPDASAGTVVCLETLEHVKHPWLALAEAFRVLKPGGALLLSVPFRHPVHDHPYDYWRMTPEALAALLEDAGFTGIDTEDSGEDVSWREGWDEPGGGTGPEHLMPYHLLAFAVARKAVGAPPPRRREPAVERYFKERLEVLEKMVAEKEEAVAPLRAKVADLTGQLAEKDAEIENARRHVEKVEAETGAREAALEEAAGYARNLEARIAELEQRLGGADGHGTEDG